jgi:hypothetical protein
MSFSDTQMREQRTDRRRNYLRRRLEALGRAHHAAVMQKISSIAAHEPSVDGSRSSRAGFMGA